MWRLIPNIPRVFRSNWNNSVVRSAPPTACGDDDNVDNSCSQKSPVFFIHRNLCCYSAGKHGKKKKGRAGDAAWEKWIQSLKRDWSSLGNLFTLETFGYGTVLLLGIHLSHYYKLWDEQNRRYNGIDGRRWLSIQLGQVTVAMPVLGWDSQTKPKSESLAGNQLLSLEEYDRKTVPAPKEDHQMGQKPKEKNPKQLFDALELNISEKFLDQAVRSDIKLLSPYLKISGDHLLSEVEEAWSGLNEHYISISLNLAAYKYIQQDEIARAIRLWQQSSSLASSNFNLGICYELGLGVETDMNRAHNFYELAAEQGHHKAMYNLARMYLTGTGVHHDVKRAIELLETAASANVTKALCDLGVLYTRSQETREKAVELFKVAAKLKDACGFYNLAVCYHTGCGVDQNLCQAVQLYNEAAQLGHSQAQLMLATFFYHGLGGLPVDKGSAAAWYKKASDQLDDFTDDIDNYLEQFHHLRNNSTANEESIESEAGSNKKINQSEKNVDEDLIKEVKLNKNTSSASFFTDIGISNGSFGENIPASNHLECFGNTSMKRPASRAKKSSETSNRKHARQSVVPVSRKLKVKHCAESIIDMDSLGNRNVIDSNKDGCLSELDTVLHTDQSAVCGIGRLI